MASITIPRIASRARGLPFRFDPALLIPILVVVLLVYLTVFPLFMLLLGSFQEEVRPREFVFTLKNYVAAYTSPFTYSTFVNSVVFAAGSATLTFVLACVLAWLVERTNVPLARWFLPIAVVPMILPGVLEAVAWIFLLHPSIGYINVALMQIFGLQKAPFDIFSVPGMIWVQAIGQIPLAFLLMSAAFKLMDPALEEAAMTAGATNWQTVRRITLRLLLPASLSALLILTVRSLESFEVPALVGIPAKTYVYTSEIFLAFRRYPPNYGLGAALAIGLLALSAVGVWLYMRATRHSERYQTVSGKAFRPRRFDLGRLRWFGFAVLCLYAIVVVLLPILVIAWASFQPFFAVPSVEGLQRLTLDNYRTVLADPRFQSAMSNSVLLAVAAPTVVMLLTSVIAWLIYKSRLRGMWALEFLGFLPITIPGLVLGMALILIYVAYFPLPVYGTIWVMLIAYTTKYLPYGLRYASGSIVQIHRELEEAASASGSTWWQTFYRVTLPLLRPGFAAGWIYICIVSFREFSTSVLLAGGNNMVLSVLVFTLYEQGRSTVVAALGVMMIVILLAIVAVFYKLSGRVGVQA